ncbi:methyl-accepting chemotaxis protein [Pelosinus sp. sgz500959]|uniref:methyl-accepting chemotaxis protein n=1 Tax=Pelosinus sp. sgz500959 TaxID=3242472 RepID=UPI0036726B35
MNFKNLSIKKKLVVSFLVVVILSSLVSSFAILRILGMRDNAKEINDSWLPSVAMMGWMNGATSDVPRLASAIAVETDVNLKAKLESELNQLLQDLEKNRKIYEKDLISGPEERKIYEKFSKDWDVYMEKLPGIIAAGKANDLALVNKRSAEAYPIWTKANDTITELITFNNKEAAQLGKESLSDAQSAYSWISILSAIVAILAIIFGWFIAARITNPLIIMVGRIQEVANGNLAIKQVEITSLDEVGQLGMALNTMTTNLRNLIRQVSQSAELVAASSEELTASAEQSAQATNQVASSITEVAQGAENQVKAVGATSAVIGQMSTGIQQVAANTTNMASISDKTANAAKEGSKAVQIAVNQMVNIEKTVTNSAKVVSKLGEQSKEIGQIVDTISGIAGQTNLLALNAAIEAARAGEQGRGFAVVADEVRKLAEQSHDAAKQIANLIREIQSDTDKAVMAMGDGTREVKLGAEVVNTAGQAFGEIVTLINQVSDQATDITAAIQQMASGSQQIVTSVREVDTIGKNIASQTQTVSAATEEQSASMEEIASSSEALSQMAQELQRAVSKFRV